MDNIRHIDMFNNPMGGIPGGLQKVEQENQIDCTPL